MEYELDRLFGLVSLARRAGKLAMGFDVVKSSVLHGKAHLLLLAKDVSEKSVRGLKLLCEEQDVPVRTLEATMDEIWFTLGKRCGILALEDAGFAKAVLKLADTPGGSQEGPGDKGVR